MAVAIKIPFSDDMTPSQANDWTKGLYPTAVQFLRSSAKEIALLVVNADNMPRFRSQLTEFADKWVKYRIAEQADREDNWQPSMGTPENPLAAIWPDLYVKQPSGPGIHVTLYPIHVRQKIGAYAFLEALHDHILLSPNCERIDDGRVPQELSDTIWQNVVTYVEGKRGSKGHVNIELINWAMREVAADLHDGAGKQKVTQGETVAGNELPKQAQDTDIHDSQGLAPEKIQPATIYEEIQIEIDRLLGDKDYSWLWEEFARHAKHFKACFEAWKSFQDWSRECERAVRNHPLSERHIWRAQSAEPLCPSTGEIADQTCWSYVTVGIIWDELAVHGDDECLVRHILRDRDPAKDAYAFTLYLMGGEQFKDRPRHKAYESGRKYNRLKGALRCVKRDVAKIASQREAGKGEEKPSETPGAEEQPPQPTAPSAEEVEARGQAAENLPLPPVRRRGEHPKEPATTNDQEQPSVETPEPPVKNWSAPMKKCDIMGKLGIDSYKKLTSCCEAGVYEIRPAGTGDNRELWEIRLDTLSANLKDKF
jgi:hypothetical protein